MGDHVYTLPELRSKLHMKRSEFARFLHVSYQLLYQWESGLTSPNLCHSRRIEEALGEKVSFRRKSSLPLRPVSRITLARQSLGLTQRELAERLGISQNCVAQWEMGRRRPSEGHLRQMERIFGYPVSGGRDDERD